MYRATSVKKPTLDEMRCLNDELKFQCTEEELFQMTGKSASSIIIDTRPHSGPGVGWPSD